MRITTKSRYGLRVMIDLAQHWGLGPQSLHKIAERQEISKKYLEQIVSPLASRGLVSVTRGYTGGYELSRPPEQITMADIFEATEGDLDLLDCQSNGEKCPHVDSCLSSVAWSGLRDVTQNYLKSRTLVDLIDPEFIRTTRLPDCPGPWRMSTQ